VTSAGRSPAARGATSSIGSICPNTNEETRAMAVDLDGDEGPDFQLSYAFSTVRGLGLAPNNADLIASGAIASSLIVTADNLVDDPTVSVAFLGADDDVATAVGGRFRDGAFMSNRSVTTEVPGEAIARIGAFIEADPIAVPVKHLEMELRPDGASGFDVYLRGTVTPEAAVSAAYRGLSQLVASDPGGHRTIRDLFDKDPVDWTISEHEFATNALMVSLFEPDITLADGPQLAFAFAVHVVPCDSGRCSNATPDDPCADRVRNGDETDVDCGGSCRRCRAGRTCGTAADCDSQACDAGVCAEPRCDDGVRDGYETDADCGGPCTTCQLGGRCWSDTDCASGECGEPCTDPDPVNCIDTDLSHDTCR
jgi:hypothetical protein